MEPAPLAPSSILRRFTRIALTVLAVSFGLGVALILIATFLDGLNLEGGPVGEWIRSVAYQLLNVLPGILLYAWVGFVGAAVGSFLNVVVYRMPRGESVAARASHCPRCDSPILAQDNVPVFGWMLLGGKCRSCHLPISARYPVVELVGGVMTLLLFAVEVGGNGRNLPMFENPGWTPLPLFGFELPLNLLACLGLHLWVAFGLLACGLIRFDGQAVPVRLVVVLIAVAFLAPVLFPMALPVAAWPEKTRLSDAVQAMSGSALIQMLFNLVVGLVCGAIVGTARYRTREAKYSVKTDWALVATGAVVGLAVGWQAAIAIGMFFGIALTGLRILEMNRVNARPKQLLIFLVTTIFWLVFWRAQVEPGLAFLPGLATPLWQIPVWVVFLTIPLFVSFVFSFYWSEFVMAEMPIDLFQPENRSPAAVDVEIADSEFFSGESPIQPDSESSPSTD